tara:strand:- start:112 stop:399 length:288 start_codon:yes stop_codon:yes gene_type:complete
MDLLLEYQIWFIAALIFIAADVILGLNFILLPFGLGASATGVSLLLKTYFPAPYSENWEALVTFFACSSLLLLLPIRRFAAKSRAADATDDINKY